MGCPVLWRSKAQRAVALSSSEAEWYALSEAAKEIKFLAQVLESMGVKVELPIVVRVDNIGTIFMAENSSATSRTRHIDTRTAFVRQYVEEGFIKVIFVKSAENHADPFTKNVTAEIYREQTRNFIAEKATMEDRKHLIQNGNRKGVRVSREGFPSESNESKQENLDEYPEGEDASQGERSSLENTRETNVGESNEMEKVVVKEDDE